MFRSTLHHIYRYHAKNIQSIKTALNSKILDKSFQKNKFQKPRIFSLIQKIQQTMSDAQQETAYFTTIVFVRSPPT